MKNKQLDYVPCAACGSSAPNIHEAKRYGWQVRDGIWICGDCIQGSVGGGLAEGLFGEAPDEP